jgi:MurNAc alpha-1-phosphate uridylyltransferase
VDAQAPYVFMGAQLLHPDLFEDSPDEPFSLNLLYDRAAAADRLFGLEHRGRWMNLKTPEALDAAKRALVD